MMALDLSSLDDTADDRSGLTATVATDAESLAQLRALVGQVFADVDAEEAAEADNEADFLPRPGHHELPSGERERTGGLDRELPHRRWDRQYLERRDAARRTGTWRGLRGRAGRAWNLDTIDALTI